MNYYNVPGRKRATWHNEPEVDPFDVFTCKTVAINDYQKIELEPCRVTLSQQETVEDLGNITITKPTDAPEDAVVRNTEDNAGEDGSEEGSDQTPAEDKTE